MLKLSGVRKEGGPSPKWAGGREWEKQKLKSEMQKYFFGEIQTDAGRKRGRDWHSNVNRERRVDWMKELHTGGFLKSPFNMYEGNSIDCSSQRQAPEEKAWESSNAGWVERGALLLLADFAVCPESPEKGDHPDALFTIPCFSPTQQHNSPGVYRGVSLNNLPTKLQRCTKAQLHHYNIYKTGVKEKPKACRSVNNPAPLYSCPIGF